jgi:hypothetical protein
MPRRQQLQSDHDAEVQRIIFNTLKVMRNARREN